MLLGRLDSPVEREPAEHASTALYKAGFDLLISQHRNESKTYERLLGRLTEGVADGALVIPWEPMPHPMEQALLDARFPMVYVDRYPEPLAGRVDVVTTSNEEAAYTLALRVISSGATRILFKFDGDNSASRDRKKGVLKAIAEKKVAGVDCTETVLGSGEKWGVLASSQHEILELKRRLVGHTVEVAGVFDAWMGDAHPFEVVHVCLQDFQTMGEEAVRVLLQKVGDEHEEPPQVHLIQPLEFKVMRLKSQKD